MDHINTSALPAKTTQKVLQSRDWPIVIAFETYPPPNSKSELKEKRESELTRTLNLTILYPPTLAGDVEVRLATWSVSQSDGLYTTSACSLRWHVCV